MFDCTDDEVFAFLIQYNFTAGGEFCQPVFLRLRFSFSPLHTMIIMAKSTKKKTSTNTTNITVQKARNNVEKKGRKIEKKNKNIVGYYILVLLVKRLFLSGLYNVCHVRGWWCGSDSGVGAGK